MVGRMGEHKAGFCYPVCQFCDLPFQAWVGVAGLKTMNCTADSRTYSTSQIATSQYKSGKTGFLRSPGSQNPGRQSQQHPLLRNLAPVGLRLCFVCFFSLPLNTMWKKPRRWGQSSQSLEVQFSSIKWRGTTPNSGNNQSGGRKMITVTQGFLRLLLLPHRIPKFCSRGWSRRKHVP